MKEITASEVRFRQEHWEKHEAPKLQARAEAILAPIFDKWVAVVHRYLMDRDLQHQRMTDDGCPLGC